MFLDPTTLHVELTSRCVLKCPRCPRTEIDLDYLNQDIDIDAFVKSFDAAALGRVKKFLFCGHTGDPIYAGALLPIIRHIKHTGNSQIVIVTNGSYKKQKFWWDLGSLLDHNDVVTFSVDGWDHVSNQQYRVNSDFASICQGIKTLRDASDVNIKWSMIYFQFNQDHVAKIQQIAQGLGCDRFEAVKSSKFDGHYATAGVDALKPRDEFVASDLLYQRNTVNFRSNVRHVIPLTPVQNHPWAQCANHAKEPFLDVRGLVMPCAWSAGGYQDNPFIERNRQRLDINLRPFVDILDDAVLWDELRDSFDRDPMPICELKCKNA